MKKYIYLMLLIVSSIQLVSAQSAKKKQSYNISKDFLW